MENKKIRWKLNLFDLLVILLALAVAAGIVWMRYQQNRAAQAAQDAGGTSGGSAVVRYVVECTQCGAEIPRARRSRLVEHPEDYRCAKCGGKLTLKAAKEKGE